MIRVVLGVRHGVSTITCLMVALVLCSDSNAGDIDAAEQLFADHCAVCHGADRGGYIGPALNRDETMLAEWEIHAKITTGGVGTLMPQHPTWRGTLSREEIDRLASLVAQQPKRQVSWGLEDIRHSLEVYVADESSLPAKPTYPIKNIDDLMVVTARGSYSAGDDAKVIFFDGRTNDKLGEIATGFAPHLVDFHPIEERWAYVRTDVGDVLKVDLYSLQVVRKVRAGLNGARWAVCGCGLFRAEHRSDSGCGDPGATQNAGTTGTRPGRQFGRLGRGHDHQHPVCELLRAGAGAGGADMGYRSGCA